MPADAALSRYSNEPFVESILSVTDFSPAAMNAFAHALMMAISLRCEFTVLQAGKNQISGSEWSRQPGVRQVLERWGYLEKGSPRSAVLDQVAVNVRKVEVATSNVTAAMIDFVEQHPVDLVVVGTEQRFGIASLLRPGPQRIMEATKTMTLFVPGADTGFVSLAHGGFNLQRVLVPVAAKPDSQPAIIHAFRSAVISTEDIVRMYLLHVEDSGPVPVLRLPERPYLSWETLHRAGNASDEILKAAQEVDANLIVMSTEGRNGVLDALRGGVTQLVVRSAPCPVLAVPVGRIRK